MQSLTQNQPVQPAESSYIDHAHKHTGTHADLLTLKKYQFQSYFTALCCSLHPFPFFFPLPAAITSARQSSANQSGFGFLFFVDSDPCIIPWRLPSPFFPLLHPAYLHSQTCQLYPEIPPLPPFPLVTSSRLLFNRTNRVPVFARSRKILAGKRGACL